MTAGWPTVKTAPEHPTKAQLSPAALEAGRRAHTGRLGPAA
ncbi:MAG TPA: hypothetical protein VF506_21400 [Streptosporangiaceae bacterium]